MGRRANAEVTSRIDKASVLMGDSRCRKGVRGYHGSGVSNGTVAEEGGALLSQRPQRLGKSPHQRLHQLLARDVDALVAQARDARANLRLVGAEEPGHARLVALHDDGAVLQERLA